MRRLYLDIGNSRFKLAEYSGEWNILETGDLEGIIDRFDEYRNSDPSLHWIVSSVRRDVSRKLAESGGWITDLKSDQIPERNLNYNTPETLGIDRYLVCLGAAAGRDKPVVVIDSGTACTIDYMNSKGVFEGGVIMPGLRLFEKAMLQHLPELPFPGGGIPGSWPGKSTAESIRFGVYGSFIHSLRGFLAEYLKGEEIPEFYLTGGDSEWIRNHLGSEFELNHQPYLLFEGMRRFSDLFF